MWKIDKVELRSIFLLLSGVILDRHEVKEQALTPNILTHESGDRKVKPPRAVLTPETQESDQNRAVLTPETQESDQNASF